MTPDELHRKRREADVSIGTLASRAGVSPNSITDIERGRMIPMPEYVDRLSGLIDEIVEARNA